MVRFERGQVTERWGSLVNPGLPIPGKVKELTGITDEMVADQPSFAEIKWEVYGRLRDRVVAAYNAPFDTAFLRFELEQAGLGLPETPVLDPLVWARQLMPNDRSHKLGRVCDKLGISLENAHRAEDDAEAAGLVLLRFADQVPVELGALLTEQASWQQAQEAAFAARRAAKAANRPQQARPTEAPAADPEVAINQGGLFG